jgi:Effector Associated Constant Component 1
MIGDGGVDGVLSLRLVLEPDPESDPEVRERLIRQLRAELSELDVESADLAAGGPAPDNAKAADPVSLGAIVVALSASGGVFTSVVETLRDWLGRHSGRHRIAVTIDGDTIELEQATAAQQDELVRAYVHRHSGDR